MSSASLRSRHSSAERRVIYLCMEMNLRRIHLLSIECNYNEQWKGCGWPFAPRIVAMIVSTLKIATDKTAFRQWRENLIGGAADNSKSQRNTSERKVIRQRKKNPSKYLLSLLSQRVCRPLIATGQWRSMAVRPSLLASYFVLDRVWSETFSYRKVNAKAEKMWYSTGGKMESYRMPTFWWQINRF